MRKIGLLFLVLLTFYSNVNAQALPHPIIYASAADRTKVLELIDKQDWAKSIVTQMRTNVDAKLATHQTNPDAITNGLPDFPENDNNTEAFANPFATAHNRVLTTAAYSSMLFYITEDEKYARFSGDIMAYYVRLLEKKTPDNATVSGNYFYDPRTIFTHFALTYDFIFNYLKKTETTIYNLETKKRESVDQAKFQKALLNIIGNGLDEAAGADTPGRFISNHHILTGPGVLFPILCVEDDKERERLFNVFWDKGTKRQASFKKTVLEMFGEQGIWPESTSYGFMPNVAMMLNVIDKFKPELKVYNQTQSIFEGMFLFENLRNPNRRFVRYGDSHRSIDATDESYRFALNMAKRQKVPVLQTKAEIALMQYYEASGGYKPTLPSSIFDNFGALELFWGEVLPTGTVQKFNYSPTVLIKHAGIALQRNYVENQNTLYGLCGIIGGAHYVHSHCTGISMELYGAEYIMGPQGGLPPSLAERSQPEHRNYFMRHGGNNTVIVNGTSKGRQSGSWGSNIIIWQNTAVNVAAEPKHLQSPISKNFSFSTQFLKDEVNNCDQQRTLGIVRTSETSAYYFDMFRSKSLATNTFHDYLYHNIGDETTVSNSKNEILQLTPTSRYATDIGDAVKSPGWSLLENTQVTTATSDAVKIRFKIAFNNRYMHLLAPSGVQREYTKALGPATREAENGYVTKKTQVIGIRQQGEAWERPFISIFEPSLKDQPTVQSVEQLVQGKITVGAAVKSIVSGKEITDYIICNEAGTSEIDLQELQLKFQGRYAIIRRETENNKSKITLYIGDGKQLTFGNHTLNGDQENKGILEVEDVVLSTEKENVKGFLVYPNPSSSEVTISIGEVNWKSLNIYNTKGQKLYSNNSGKPLIKVSTAEFRNASGVITIELIDKLGKKSNQKLIIE